MIQIVWLKNEVRILEIMMILFLFSKVESLTQKKFRMIIQRTLRDVLILHKMSYRHLLKGVSERVNALLQEYAIFHFLKPPDRFS